METKIFPYLENMLDLTARRQKALAANIANLDTPGYKSIDVSFRNELELSLQPVSTSEDHLNPLSAAATSRFIQVEGKLKPNGNTVDLDSQMIELNKNGMQYVMLIQYMSQKLKTLRAAIIEGGK